MVSNTECNVTHLQTVIWSYYPIFPGQTEAAETNFQRNFSLGNSLSIHDNF